MSATATVLTPEVVSSLPAKLAVVTAPADDIEYIRPAAALEPEIVAKVSPVQSTAPEALEYVRAPTLLNSDGAIVPAPKEEFAERSHNLTEGARASGLVTSAHSLLKAADLDWDPEFAPLTCQGLPVSERVGRGVVRSDTKKTIGIVGRFYKLIPHRRQADLADAIVGAYGTDLHLANAGHRLGGARTFIQLQTAPRIIGKDIRGETVGIKDQLTLLTSHDGSIQFIFGYSAICVVCDNTYRAALEDALRGGAIRHNSLADDLVTEAIRVAGEARKLGAAFDNAALKLLSTPFTDESMVKLASALFVGENAIAEKARAKLIDAYTTAPGAAPGTAWGAAQAVTNYTSHLISVVGDTDRAFNLATGEGRGSEIQATAWWHLTTDEGAAALQLVQPVKLAA